MPEGKTTWNAIDTVKMFSYCATINKLLIAENLDFQANVMCIYLTKISLSLPEELREEFFELMKENMSSQTSTLSKYYPTNPTKDKNGN